MTRGSNLQSLRQVDDPVAGKRYKLVRHSDSGMALILGVADYPSGSVGGVVLLLLRWDRGLVMHIVGFGAVEMGIGGWSWVSVDRL